MEIAELIEPEHVIIGLEVADKARLLSVLAERAAQFAGASAETILQALRKRESFGSTGIGRGIAIPHTGINGLKRAVGFVARLDHPIDFDSVDGQPVDLVFLLLTPPSAANENVAALAAVSRRLRDAAVLTALRSAMTSREFYARLTGS